MVGMQARGPDTCRRWSVASRCSRQPLFYLHTRCAGGELYARDRCDAAISRRQPLRPPIAPAFSPSLDRSSDERKRGYEGFSEEGAKEQREKRTLNEKNGGAENDEEERGGEGGGGKDCKGRWCKDRTIVCFLTAISSQ